MNPLLKKLLIIPVLVGLVLLGYGFVNLMDMMKTFESDAWVLPIFTLGLLAVVPIVIFMVARDDIERNRFACALSDRSHMPIQIVEQRFLALKRPRPGILSGDAHRHIVRQMLDEQRAVARRHSGEDGFDQSLVACCVHACSKTEIEHAVSGALASRANDIFCRAH